MPDSYHVIASLRLTQHLTHDLTGRQAGRGMSRNLAPASQTAYPPSEREP